MEFGWSALWFIIAVSLLVTIHEFGHFWVARKLGFKVLRFSVGFGKPLYKRIGAAPDYTEYVIAMLPLGGYVRMLDERDGTVDPVDAPRAFGAKHPWKRILVMLAGPAANILFAVLALWVMYWINGITHVKAVVDKVAVGSVAAAAGLRDGDEMLSIDGDLLLDRGDAALGLLDAISGDGAALIEVRGRDGAQRNVNLSVADRERRLALTEPNQLITGLGFEFWEPLIPPIIGVVDAKGPAAKAGIQVGDTIKAVNGVPVKSFQEVATYVNARPDETLTLVLSRKGSDFSRSMTTVSEVRAGKKIGRLLIAEVQEGVPYPPEMRTSTDVGPVDAFAYSVHKAWQMTAAHAKFFVRMLTGDLSTKNISGFISIAKVTGDAAHGGITSFVFILVLLSLSLGFLNLLPIPILDGGQVVFQLAEWVKGRPLSDRVYMVGQQAGLLLLVLLMGVALFNDLAPYLRLEP